MQFYPKDIWQFVRKLTFARIANVIKLYLSYQLTKILKKPIQWGVPMTIAIEPTTACNLRCPECPSGLRSFTRETGNLKEDFFRATIDIYTGNWCTLYFIFKESHTSTLNFWIW
jgi:hypothetical protein